MGKSRRRSRSAPLICCVVMVVAFSACPEAPPPSASSRVTIDTIGDTISVMTSGRGLWRGRAALIPTLTIGALEGPAEYLFEAIASLTTGRDGTIYVLDRGAGQVRAFDSDGVFLRSYGRRGEGPGELRSPLSVVVLSDGRVLVSDASNRRIQTYLPDGTPHDEWTILHPNYATSTPLFADADDRVLVVTKDQRSDIMDSEEILIHLTRFGEILDTTAVPTAGHEPPVLEASFQSADGSRRSWGPVPFTPWPVWGLHPDGRVLLALGHTYTLDRIASDGSVFRIGRAYEPVPVGEDERRYMVESTTNSMRDTDPSWRWNGPPIPDLKPPYDRVYIGRRGRIWTRVSTPRHVAPSPSHDPADPRSLEVTLTGETILDVFESDGTYLGQVGPPDDFRLLVTTFDGDHVWTVVYDDLGVQRVTRYELRPPIG